MPFPFIVHMTCVSIFTERCLEARANSTTDKAIVLHAVNPGSMTNML